MNAQLLFYGAWLCGIAGFISGVDGLVSGGGVLLVLAAGLVWTHPDDPVNRRFDAAAGHRRGRVSRAFVASLFAAIGIAWFVWGVS